MIEDKIEIVIPTYNRVNYLNRTLEYLFNSPFKDCKITIRDNCSQDETPEICEKYSKLFKNFNIIRNKINIGGNANIWRSYEEATYPYVWVLADNDYLNFDNCDDFINAIESEKYDLIICCSGLYKYKHPNGDNSEPISELLKKENLNKNYLENTAHELAHIMKKHYFIIATFLPANIYRTSLIDSETLMRGYNYISRSCPHYALISKVLNNNLFTYKTKKDCIFIRSNPDDWEISSFTWHIRYLECALLINDEKIRAYALQTTNAITSIPYYIGNSKILKEDSLRLNIYSFINIMYQIHGWSKGTLYCIFIFICYLIPSLVYKKVIRVYNI